MKGERIRGRRGSEKAAIIQANRTQQCTFIEATASRCSVIQRISHCDVHKCTVIRQIQFLIEDHRDVRLLIVDLHRFDIGEDERCRDNIDGPSNDVAMASIAVNDIRRQGQGMATVSKQVTGLCGNVLLTWQRSDSRYGEKYRWRLTSIINRY